MVACDGPCRRGYSSQRPVDRARSPCRHRTTPRTRQPSNRRMTKTACASRNRQPGRRLTRSRASTVARSILYWPVSTVNARVSTLEARVNSGRRFESLWIGPNARLRSDASTLKGAVGSRQPVGFGGPPSMRVSTRPRRTWYGCTSSRCGFWARTSRHRARPVSVSCSAMPRGSPVGIAARPLTTTGSRFAGCCRRCASSSTIAGSFRKRGTTTLVGPDSGSVAVAAPRFHP